MNFKFQTKAPANVTFKKKGHTYKDQYGKEYVSVTTLIGKYHKKFDTQYWSTYKACKDVLEKINLWSRYKNKAGGWQSVVDYFKKSGHKLDATVYKRILKRKQWYIDEWKSEGDIACALGNKQHDTLEKLVLSHKKVRVGNRKIADVSPATLLDMQGFVHTGNSIHPELLLWNEKYRLAGQADLVEKTGNEIVIKDYKGLELNTPIATPEGWKVIGDIKEGDTIFDSNGFTTKVEEVSSIHNNPCYKITFDTNDTIICDHEHKWITSKLIRKQVNKIASLVEVKIEMTTLEIFNYFNNNSDRIRIPVAKPLNLEKVRLPIDPYILGIWLADGSKSGGVITIPDSRVIDEILLRGYEISSSHGNNETKANMYTVYGLRTKLKKLGLLGNKFIPMIYFRSSYEQRLDLLRGFMDGDGHFNRTRKSCVTNTTKIWQRDNISQLISTLGFKVTIIPYKASGFGKTNIQAWSLNFGPKISPFLVRNKDYENVVAGMKRRSNIRYISNIEKIETVPTKCLSVDSNDKTYLAGHNLIVTHNTCKEIKMDPFMGTMMLDPLQYLPDTNYSKFTIQLSTYGWMLEELGYRVTGIVMIHIDRITGEVIREYPLAYRKDLVEKMLEDYDSKRTRKLN